MDNFNGVANSLVTRIARWCRGKFDSSSARGGAGGVDYPVGYGTPRRHLIECKAVRCLSI